MKQPTKLDGVRAAREAAGGPTALGRALGLSHVSIVRWQQVPYARLDEVARVTRLPKYILRPDIFSRRSNSR
jgi:hypothetical protein